MSSSPGSVDAPPGKAPAGLSRRGFLLGAGASALALLGSGLLASSRSGAPPPLPVVGVNGHFYFLEEQARVEEALHRYRQSGGRYLRECIPWGSVERRRGVDDWRAADRLVELAGRQGVELVVVVVGAPRWARGRQASDPPRDLAAFEAFMHRAAARFRGRIQAWQIWNEVDCAAFWGPDLPFRERVERYSALLQAGERGVRAGSPEARVLMAGLGLQDRLPVFEAPRPGRSAAAGHRREVGSRPVPEGETSLDFVRTLLARPGLDRSLVAAAHMLRPAHEAVLRPVMQELRRLRPGTPLWITESGVPSGARRGCTEERQAAFVEETCRQAGPLGAQALFLFELVDRPAEPDNPEAHFGLLRRDLSAKASFAAFQKVMEQRRGAEGLDLLGS